MKVEEVMTRGVVSVRENTPFKEIAETLIDNEISAVPVLDDAGRVIGISPRPTCSQRRRTRANPNEACERLSRTSLPAVGSTGSTRLKPPKPGT